LSHPGLGLSSGSFPQEFPLKSCITCAQNTERHVTRMIQFCTLTHNISWVLRVVFAFYHSSGA
jgi:hypothetical protein